MRRIILASTSPRRKELLERVGLKFEVVGSSYEEDMTLKMKPKQLAKFLSRGKAEDVAKKFDDAIVIAADTIVALGSEVMGKPHTPEKAKKMLWKLSGKANSVITGMTIIDTKTKKIFSGSYEAKVYIKKLSSKEIDLYVSSGEPLDKAGAYAVQGLSSLFVEKTMGNFFMIMGLPVFELYKELKKFGVDMLEESEKLL